MKFTAKPWFIITAVLGLAGSTAWAGNWWWTGFIVALGGVLGLTEAVAIKKTGNSLSTMFGEMQTKNKWKIAGGIIGFIAMLIAHLFNMGE